jgi:nicotinate-nucleotide adenylyltransferase
VQAGSLRYLARALSKIGIYGGTFDPIHHAHLILAREAMEHLQLERVIFVPARISPHKLNEQPTESDLRLEMLRGALIGEPRFTVDDREIRRPGPSFTVDTIEEFRHEATATLELFYFIGSDNLSRLQSWHRFAELRELVQFVVLERGAAPLGAFEFPVIRRLIDISASDIRKRVASGYSIQYLVPAAVEEIIRRERLYQEP